MRQSRYIFIGIVSILLAALVYHPEPKYTDGQICDAIFKAEGGAKAKYLYGIRSVHYEDLKEARSICLRTIRNNRKRWKGAYLKGSFLSFLSSKYAPLSTSDDSSGLNHHWLKNVKYFLTKP